MEKNINKYLNEMKLTGRLLHLKTNTNSSYYKPMKMNRDDLRTFEKLYEENISLMSNYNEI